MLRTQLNACLATLRRSLQPLYREEEGAHLVLLSLMLTVLLGFAGLAIDGSNLYYQQQRMQIAADAAALGGARQLGLDAGSSVVGDTIHDLAFANYATAVNWDLINNDRGVHVVASRTFESFFAKIFGYDTFTVSAQSDAQYEPVTGADGLFPLTLDCNCADDTTQVPPRDGEDDDIEIDPPAGCSDLYPIALSQASLVGVSSGQVVADIYNGVQPGNFGWLSWEGTTNTPDLAARLTPPGNSYLYTNPYNPGDSTVSIGDWVLGSPGVDNASEVRAALDLLKTIDITVPVWNNVAGSGSNAVYQVVDFARVRLLSYELPGENVISAVFLGYDEQCRDITTRTGMVTMVDSAESTYEITFLSHLGDTWSYQVRKLAGNDLSHWSLGVASCLNQVAGTEPGGAVPGTDPATGFTGLRWDTAAGFESGVFSFTLDKAYPAGSIQAQATVGSQAGTVPIRGPVCEDAAGGEPGGAPEEGVCLTTFDFEVDAAGAALSGGQIIANQWAAWGIRVTTLSPTGHPAMIFDSANPTGNDPDLGSPHENWGGPGKGLGGGPALPGANSTPLGKVLIVAETNNPANPDDAAGGGTLVFTFDYPVRIDEVHVLDIDDASAAGTVRAYSTQQGGDLIASTRMMGLGDNSFQIVPVDGSNVQRLEISLPKGGAVPAIVSCRTQQDARYRVGNLIWADSNNNGVQESGESGIAGVDLELYAAGQTNLIAQATTNAGGEYLFTNLPAGSYVVKVAASNFAVGGPLEGALYSPAGSSGDKDSDFTAAGGASAVVPLNGGDNFNIDGGFYHAAAVEPGPESGVIVLSDNQESSYEIALAGRSGNEWTYRVTEVRGRNLEQWNLGIANCLDHIVSVDPSTGYAAGPDSAAAGFTGVRWSVAPTFSEGYFKFILDGDYPVGNVSALAKANKFSAQINIAGPDCSVAPTPPEDPEDPGDPDPSAEAPVCSFSWLDWNGVTSSYQELKSDMDDTGRSGVWRVGDVVQPGPPVSASIYTQEGLDARRGQKVKIPLSEYNGSGYAICGFAEVKLVDYALQDNDRWLSLDWLTSLIRGVESDPDATDYRARDVRVLR